MKKTALILFILLTTKVILASQTTSLTKVTFIYTYETAAVLKIEGTNNNADNCTYSSAAKYLQLNFDSPAKSKMYSAILTAFASGKKIRLGHNGCATWGPTTIPKIYRVDLSN